jgi:hypothetical protein
MADEIVKILVDDDGVEIDDPQWHAIDPVTGTVYCTGEFFGVGESAVVYETKKLNRGDAVCTRCRKQLHQLACLSRRIESKMVNGNGH